MERGCNPYRAPASGSCRTLKLAALGGGRTVFRFVPEVTEETLLLSFLSLKSSFRHSIQADLVGPVIAERWKYEPGEGDLASNEGRPVEAGR
jgi:hypothetical protein